MENAGEHQIETQCMQDLVDAHQFYFEFVTRKVFFLKCSNERHIGLREIEAF